MPPIHQKPDQKPFRLPGQPYTVHPRIRSFFKEYVNKPFDEHRKTPAWLKEVVKQDWRYHSNEILERGRANFRTAKNGLSPADQVIVYCHYYMHQHAASGLHVLLRGLIDHKMGFLHNPVMIDFGCGPMTAAISLTWYNLVANKRGEADKLLLRYIGIDRAAAMLDHCREMPKPSNLFRAGSTFDFEDRFTANIEVPKRFARLRTELGSQKITLLLSFSYVVGSGVLDVKKLVDFVKSLLKLLKPRDLACLVFQNAWAGDMNVKWDEFKEAALST